MEKHPTGVTASWWASLLSRNQGEGLAGGDEWPSATDQRLGLRPNYGAVYLMSLFKASCVPVTENKPETAGRRAPAFPCLGSIAAGPGPLCQSLCLDSRLAAACLLRAGDRDSESARSYEMIGDQLGRALLYLKSRVVPLLTLAHPSGHFFSLQKN